MRQSDRTHPLVTFTLATNTFLLLQLSCKNKEDKNDTDEIDKKPVKCRGVTWNVLSLLLSRRWGLVVGDNSSYASAYPLKCGYIHHYTRYLAYMR